MNLFEKALETYPSPVRINVKNADPDEFIKQYLGFKKGNKEVYRHDNEADILKYANSYTSLIVRGDSIHFGYSSNFSCTFNELRALYESPLKDLYS